jgi:aldehyde:ferredoxin oxidoreductase
MPSILRVNLSDLTVTREEVPAEYGRAGGRALTSRIVLREVDRACAALGAQSKLVFAPGLVVARQRRRVDLPDELIDSFWDEL